MKKKTKRVMKEKRKERTKRLDTITKMEMITKAKEEEQKSNVESIILYSYPLHSSTQ